MDWVPPISINNQGAQNNLLRQLLLKLEECLHPNE